MMTALSNISRTIHEMTMNIPATGVRYLTHSLFFVSFASSTSAANSTMVAAKIAPSANAIEKRSNAAVV